MIGYAVFQVFGDSRPLTVRLGRVKDLLEARRIAPLELGVLMHLWLEEASS